MNKITHYSVILVLVSALLLLPACTPVTDNSDAHIAALITELRTLLKSLYNSQTNTIYANTNSDDLGALSVQVTAIQEAGAANKIESEHIQITALRTGFNDKCTEFHTQFAVLNAKVENNYTADSWKAFTQAKTPIDESVPYTYGKITEKIDTITTALSILVTKDGNGSENPPTEDGNPGTEENPPTEEETPETPDGVGEAIINKPILFNGTDLIFDDLPIGTSTKTITLTINKDPAATTDKISLKLISDLQRELEGTGETKRTVNLILGAGMNGYTLNGPDALNLHVGDYDGVKVSEIKPEDLEHGAKLVFQVIVKETFYDLPDQLGPGAAHPRKVITADTKEIVLDGKLDAFYTMVGGGKIKPKDDSWNNVTLATQSHPSGRKDGIIVEVSPTELANYLTNLGPNATPILDITMNNGYNRGNTNNVPENLYETLYPVAKRYLNDDIKKFDIKQGNKGSGFFETNGISSSTTGKQMFNGPNLNTNWAKIDAEILMKFKQFDSVQNLIVEGTVPAGELLNGKNLAFTGDASQLAKVSIGGITIYENLPAKKGGYDNVQFKKIGKDDVSFIFMDTLNVLNIEKVGSGRLIDTHDKMNTGTIHKNSDIYIQGPSSQFSSTEAPDYEKFWKESNGILSSKSSRVISAQQQKTR